MVLRPEKRVGGWSLTALTGLPARSRRVVLPIAAWPVFKHSPQSKRVQLVAGKSPHLCASGNPIQPLRGLAGHIDPFTFTAPAPHPASSPALSPAHEFRGRSRTWSPTRAVLHLHLAPHHLNPSISHLGLIGHFNLLSVGPHFLRDMNEPAFRAIPREGVEGVSRLAKITPDHLNWEKDWESIEKLVEPILQKHQAKYEQLEQSGSTHRDKHLANRDATRGRTTLKLLQERELHSYQLSSSEPGRASPGIAHLLAYAIEKDASAGPRSSTSPRPFDDVRQELDDIISVRIEDEVYTAQQNLEDHVRDAIMEATDQVEEKVVERLSSASVCILFG
ncbi:uncharacterized protein B0T15DRAFT_513884 [Chaetomium strumarium]|uniref:Uncharacterized protein n=1 Tax=Chaetomium strumarium TaxID=1170767 RepID=A0AAJ0GPI3_9PEZI|nr:hypothetical protein B0T15DRAFT_513884 [Chaetomium strumarium]